MLTEDRNRSQVRLEGIVAKYKVTRRNCSQVQADKKELEPSADWQEGTGIGAMLTDMKEVEQSADGQEELEPSTS